MPDENSGDNQEKKDDPVKSTLLITGQENAPDPSTPQGVAQGISEAEPEQIEAEDSHLPTPLLGQEGVNATPEQIVAEDSSAVNPSTPPDSAQGINNPMIPQSVAQGVNDAADQVDVAKEVNAAEPAENTQIPPVEAQTEPEPTGSNGGIEPVAAAEPELLGAAGDFAIENPSTPPDSAQGVSETVRRVRAEASAEPVMIERGTPVRNFVAELLAKARDALKSRKEKKLMTILALTVTHKTITHKDVEKTLRVSDATAARYLDELVKRGKLRRLGNPHQPKYELII
jgi:hypothetical protein